MNAASPALTLALPSVLTMATAAQQQRALLAQFARARTGAATTAGATLVLDAAALTDFDSAALAVLLALARQARAVGLVAHVVHWPARLQSLAAAYGVLELLDAAQNDASL